MSIILKMGGIEFISQRWLADMLIKLYKEDLSTHCYAIYYLTHEPNRVEIVLKVSGSNIESYALIWHGDKFTIMNIYEVYIWNPNNEIISKINIQPNMKVDIQLYNASPSDLKIIIEHFEKLGFKRFHVEEFYDMICSHESFKPSPMEKLAVKLGKEHAALYKDLERERGIEISLDEAAEILKTYTHYGVIVDGIIASIAARYTITPEIHIIGGVFTKMEYRGRGYAKAVVSALTREIVKSGVLAGLNVEIDNEPAIKVYTKLGYKIVKSGIWIFANH